MNNICISCVICACILYTTIPLIYIEIFTLGIGPVQRFAAHRPTLHPTRCLEAGLGAGAIAVEFNLRDIDTHISHPPPAIYPQ